MGNVMFLISGEGLIITLFDIHSAQDSKYIWILYYFILCEYQYWKLPKEVF